MIVTEPASAAPRKGLKPVPAEANSPRRAYRDLLARTRSAALSMRSVVNVVVAVTNAFEPGLDPQRLLVDIGFVCWTLLRLLLVRAHRSRLVLADIAVTTAYVACTPLLVDDTAFVTGYSAMLAVAGTAVVAFAIETNPKASLAATVTVAGSWAGGAMLAGVDNPLSIFSLDFLIVEWLLALILRRAVLHAADITDTAINSVAAAAVTSEVDAARRRSQRQQWATLHDTAASTLALIGQGAETDPTRLAKQIDRDLTAIAATPTLTTTGPVDIVTALRGEAQTTSTPAELHGRTTLIVDAHLADALIGAAREALTNVDKHARAQYVSIDIEDGQIVITDNGRGFDLEDPRVAQRHGVRNSMIRRLADAGARADILTSPGAGTKVVLRWQREPTDPTVGAGHAAVDNSRRLVRGYGYGLCAVATITTALQAPRAITHPGTHTSWQAAIMAFALATIAVGAIDIRFGLPAPLRTTVVTALIATATIQVLLLDPAHFTTGANWAIGTLGWHLAALVYRRPRTRALTALALLWAGGGIAMLASSPHPDTAIRFAYYLTSVAVAQTAAIWFTGYLLRAVIASQQASDEETKVKVRRSIEAAVELDFAERYAKLATTIAPLLRQVAATPDPGRDPHVRAACLIESARLRRLFAQTDNLDHPLLLDLRPTIAAAEARGVAVTVDAATRLPNLAATTRTRLLVLATLLLDGACTHARIVITHTAAGTTDTGEFVVSVVADTTPSTRHAVERAATTDPTATVTVFVDTCWVETHHPPTVPVQGAQP